MSKLEELRTHAPSPAQVMLSEIEALPQSRERSIAATHVDSALVLSEVYGYAAHEDVAREVRYAKAWLAIAPRFAGQEEGKT